MIKTMTKTELICSHHIEYWFEKDENRELDDNDIEHIQQLLIEDYVAGELCQYDSETDETCWGWWEIRRN